LIFLRIQNDLKNPKIFEKLKIFDGEEIYIEENQFENFLEIAACSKKNMNELEIIDIINKCCQKFFMKNPHYWISLFFSFKISYLEKKIFRF